MVFSITDFGFTNRDAECSLWGHWIENWNSPGLRAAWCKHPQSNKCPLWYMGKSSQLRHCGVKRNSRKAGEKLHEPLPFHKHLNFVTLWGMNKARFWTQQNLEHSSYFAGGTHEVRHEGLRVPEVTSEHDFILAKGLLHLSLMSWCCHNKKEAWRTGLTTKVWWPDLLLDWWLWEIEHSEVWSDKNFLTRNRVDS